MTMSSITKLCVVRKLLTPVFKSCLQTRQYASTLFVPDEKANLSCAFVTPELDLETRLADVDKLEDQLRKRGMTFDISSLHKSWKGYRDMMTKMEALESERVKIAEKVEQLASIKGLNDDDRKKLEHLKQSGKVLRQDLKSMKKSMGKLEEDVIVTFLKLPNELDIETPLDQSVVLQTIGSKPVVEAHRVKSHLDIGQRLGLLVYQNSIVNYLCNDAALFELGILRLAGKTLSKNNLTRVSCVDFSKSLVLEGSGLNHESPLDSFILQSKKDIEGISENKLHLVGGASLVSFLAMHTKQLINPKHLPLRYFSVGREYKPTLDGHSSKGLFSISQSSVAHAFVVVQHSGNEEYRNEINKLIEVVMQIYDQFASHYRIILKTSKQLNLWESYKVSIEMWSNYYNEYIEVGYLSAYGNYFSKRLLIAYQTPTGRDFPVVISGTILSVPKILGCLMEENPDNFIIPKDIAKQVMPSS